MGLLVGCDGVLVSAKSWPVDTDLAFLRLVISHVLDFDDWFTGFVLKDDDASYPVGGQRVGWENDYELIVNFYECEPAFVHFKVSGVAELILDSPDGEMTYLSVLADHLAVYLVHHRPHLQDQI